MKRLHVVGIIVFLAVLALGVYWWMSYSDLMFALKHGTSRWAAVIQIFIGGIVVHKISWARATIIFSIMLGLGIIDIALSL